MPIIIQFGWSNQYLFPDDAIKFLSQIRKVSEKDVNKIKKYFLEDDYCPSVTFIREQQVVIEGTEEEAQDFKKLYHENEQAKSDYLNRAWKAEAEVTKVKEELGALKALCPTSHGKVTDNDV